MSNVFPALQFSELISLQVCEARMGMSGCREGSRAVSGNTQLNCVRALQTAPENLAFHQTWKF